jgi:hypothetical protein
MICKLVARMERSGMRDCRSRISAAYMGVHSGYDGKFPRVLFRIACSGLIFSPHPVFLPLCTISCVVFFPQAFQSTPLHASHARSH